MRLLTKSPNGHIIHGSFVHLNISMLASRTIAKARPESNLLVQLDLRTYKLGKLSDVLDGCFLCAASIGIVMSATIAARCLKVSMLLACLPGLR